MLAIALGVLVVTAGITASLARRTATDSARHELQQKAPEVASALTEVFSGADKLTLQQLRDRLQGTSLAPRVKRLIETTLTVSDGAVIALDADGEQQEILGRLFGTESSLVQLPPGVSSDDLDTEALLAGETQTGRDGDTVFVATPLAPVRGLTPVVVLGEGGRDAPLRVVQWRRAPCRHRRDRGRRARGRDARATDDPADRRDADDRRPHRPRRLLRPRRRDRRAA